MLSNLNTSNVSCGIKNSGRNEKFELENYSFFLIYCGTFLRLELKLKISCSVCITCVHQKRSFPFHWENYKCFVLSMQIIMNNSMLISTLLFAYVMIKMYQWPFACEVTLFRRRPNIAFFIYYFYLSVKNEKVRVLHSQLHKQTRKQIKHVILFT